MAIIGLIELPALKLLDSSGANWTAFRRYDPLGGKQIVAASLEAAGHQVDIVNMKDGEEDVEMGQVEWNGRLLTKIGSGRSVAHLGPDRADLWGVSVNYLQEREVACDVIRHVAAAGRPIVVGGSDALATPEPYLAAGATAVVLDKSGAGNAAIVDHVLGSRSDSVTGVRFASGEIRPNRRPPLATEEWPLPSAESVRATLGARYWEAPLSSALSPIGAVMLDLGCDRRCDFCQTPSYRVGYSSMSPQRASEWIRLQKEQGARAVIVLSDQFLGRVLWPGGRSDVLAIMQSFRDFGMPVLWGNGLELAKATRGRGLPNGDPSPDDELVRALWGWDGERGCAQAYIPAERPVSGPEAYEKLLSWQHHCALLEAIVRAGVPDITYGVIVGLPDDSPASLGTLERSVGTLRQRLRSINANLKFRVVPYAIRPLPGTPQTSALEQAGLLRFHDSAICGGFWTACADTHHMSYAEVSDWQSRLMNGLSDNEADFQGITGIT